MMMVILVVPEYLYGMSGHYNSDVNEKDTEYESGSEYYR